ncbi:MAG: hypothetical protein ACK444_06080 [Flavobacteriales bacterium]|jgi:hypothetical protein
MSAYIVLPYLSQGIKEFDFTGYSNNECRANGSFLFKWSNYTPVEVV